MRCEEVGAKLSLYVAGDIERQGSREAIAAHLEACESCQALADEWQASRDTFLMHEPPEFDAAFFDGVRRDVMRQISQAPPPPLLARLLGQPFGQRTMAYAAAFSVLVCAVILTSHFIGQKETPSVAVEKKAHDASADVQTNVPRPPNVPTAGGGAIEEAIVVSKPQPIPEQRRRVRRARAGAPGAAHEERLLNPPDARDGGQAAALTGVQEVAASSGAQEASATVEGSARPLETAAADRKMLRIEFQTSDPNVRIIWLSPQTTDHASSNKVNDRR